MSELRVLLLRDAATGPWHWQQWLTNRLAEHGVALNALRLPATDRPALPLLLAELQGALDAVPETEELVVVGYSRGAALWLQHVARFDPALRRADRVLLCAPAEGPPPDVDVSATRRAAGMTRLVVGTGDEQLPMLRAHTLADRLGVDLDVILGGEHLTTEAGYGPWPAMLRWVLHGTAPLVDRYEAELARGELV
ncbi:alpha/beta hydrolase [Salinifilum ghardaiensis]